MGDTATGNEHNDTTSAALATIAPPATVADDSDPDFDDLDDVLDQFSASVQSKREPHLPPPQPTPTASGPGRPVSSGALSATGTPPPLVPADDEEPEEDFMARLTSEMTSALGSLNPDPSASMGDMSKIREELDEFTSAMEKQGVKPEDLLKEILGDVDGVGEHIAKVEGSQTSARSTTTPTDPVTSQSSANRSNDSSNGGSGSEKASSSSFESSIRRTMERMQASDSRATSAAATGDSAGIEGNPSLASEEDMLATLLKVMESSTSPTSKEGEGADQDDQLNTLFLSMMQQLTSKDILYEPMKELDSKFPAWLSKQQQSRPPQSTTTIPPPSPPSPSSSPPPSSSSSPSSISDSDHARYTHQHRIVADIVSIFERPSYSDQDPSCRALIWDKMQVMQGLGSPPEDLIGGAPLSGLMGGLGGLGAGLGGVLGGEDVGGTSGKEGGELEGCPTQ